MTRTTVLSLGLGCAFLLTGVTSASAQLPGFPADARIAIVDVDRVAALSGEGKAATAKLEDLRSKKTAEVSARGKEVEALQAKLAKTGALVDDAGRLRLQREFDRARIDFQRFTADAEAEVQAAQQETIRWFNTKLFPVINEIATEKKLWAIFNAQDALWFNPSLDLTEEVAKRLDAAAVAKR